MLMAQLRGLLSRVKTIYLFRFHEEPVYRSGGINMLIRSSVNAGVAMERQDWPEAARLWKETVDALGSDAPVDVWINLSMALRKQGRFGRAEKVVLRGQKKYQNYIGLHNEFAEIAHSRQDWPEAIRRWRAILDDFIDKKRLAAVYVRLSQAYIKNRDFSRAEEVLEEGMSYHHQHIHIRSAWANLAMEKGNWSEAAKRWRTILKDFGNDTPVGSWVSLATSLRQAQKFDQAEAIVAEGFEKFPGDLELKIASAEIASDRKDWSKAFDIWKTVADEIAAAYVTLRLKLYVRFNASVAARLANIEEYKNRIRLYMRSRRRRKIAIYTSFTQGYDDLKLPETIDDRFDYVVFSDDPVDGLGVFDVRPLNQPEFKDDGSRATRYPKTHPHVLFKGYDVAVWVDTSLMIVGDLMPMIEDFLKSSQPIGNATHPHRQSLAEEIEACIDLGKDDPAILKKQWAFYNSQGFDTRDLANNGVLMFNLKRKKLGPIMETWWDQICRFSKRDQLSFNYALFKNKSDRYRLTMPPSDIRNHQVFVFVPHQTEGPLLEELYRQL